MISSDAGRLWEIYMYLRYVSIWIFENFMPERFSMKTVIGEGLAIQNHQTSVTMETGRSWKKVTTF